MMTKLTAPSGCWRVKSTTGLGRRGIVAAGRAATDISVIPDTRVEHRVEQVDHEIDDDVEAGDQHHHRLDQREVVARHALYEQHAAAVEIEHLLGDDKPADQEREL